MARNSAQAQAATQAAPADMAGLAQAIAVAASVATAPVHKYHKAPDMRASVGSARFTIAKGCEAYAASGNGPNGKPTVMAMVAHAAVLAMQASGKETATGYEIGAAWAQLWATRDARLQGLKIGLYTGNGRAVPCMAWLAGYITGGCNPTKGYTARA